MKHVLTKIFVYTNSSSPNTKNSSAGMLQICDSNGNWTAVCDYGWSCNHAIIACKQLGYTNPSKVKLYIICIYNTINIEPIYHHNAGGWTKFGFGPYYYCSTYYSSLFSCSSRSLFYRNSYSYCDPVRDTVYLQCVKNQSKFITIIYYSYGNIKGAARLYIGRH